MSLSLDGPAERFALARAACGGVSLALCGTRVVLRASGALWIDGTRTLIAADLHLEKGSAYAARGQLLPPYDTRATLARLRAEIEATRARTVVLLGDSFHDPGAESRMAADDLATIRDVAEDCELVWVVGNHDADGPALSPGRIVGTMEVGPLRLVHEPAAGPAHGEVAGHLHPCAKARGFGRSVRRRCFLTDGSRIVLPAFGAYAGGLNVLDRAFSPLFAAPPAVAALGEGRVHVLRREALAPD